MGISKYLLLSGLGVFNDELVVKGEVGKTLECIPLHIVVYTSETIITVHQLQWKEGFGLLSSN